MKIRKRIHGVIFGAVVLLTSFVLAASEAAAQTNAGDEYYLKKLEGVNLSENLCCVSEKTDGTGMYIWDGKKVWLLNYKDGGLSGIFASEDESGGYIYRDFFSVLMLLAQQLQLLIPLLPPSRSLFLLPLQTHENLWIFRM